MGKRKTNYSSDWEKQYTCFLQINGGGISQVYLNISHSGRQLHLQPEKAGQNQSMISLNPSSVSTITKPKVVFSSKESIIEAEIRQLTPIFHLLQLMAMENYSEKCSQVQIVLKDVNKARRKLNILFNSG